MKKRRGGGLNISSCQILLVGKAASLQIIINRNPSQTQTYHLLFLSFFLSPPLAFTQFYCLQILLLLINPNFIYVPLAVSVCILTYKCQFCIPSLFLSLYIPLNNSGIVSIFLFILPRKPINFTFSSFSFLAAYPFSS